MGGRKDKLIAVSLSKLESQNAFQPPPVKRLVTPTVNRQPMRYTRYSEPSPTSTTQSSKICQRGDTKFQVSTFLSPYVPVFFFQSWNVSQTNCYPIFAKSTDSMFEASFKAVGTIVK